MPPRRRSKQKKPKKPKKIQPSLPSLAEFEAENKNTILNTIRQHPYPSKLPFSKSVTIPKLSKLPKSKKIVRNSAGKLRNLDSQLSQLTNKKNKIQTCN